MWAHEWRPKIDVGCLSHRFLLCFWDRDTHLTRSSPVGQKATGSAGFYLLNAGIISTYRHAWLFMWVLRNWTQVSVVSSLMTESSSPWFFKTSDELEGDMYLLVYTICFLFVFFLSLLNLEIIWRDLGGHILVALRTANWKYSLRLWAIFVGKSGTSMDS